MSSRHQLEVLRLYRDLLRYAQTLKYTDVNFYLSKVKKDFAKGKTLENEQDIARQIAVKFFIRIRFLRLIYFSFRRKVENFSKTNV